MKIRRVVMLMAVIVLMSGFNSAVAHLSSYMYSDAEILKIFSESTVNYHLKNYKDSSLHSQCKRVDLNRTDNYATKKELYVCDAIYRGLIKHAITSGEVFTGKCTSQSVWGVAHDGLFKLTRSVKASEFSVLDTAHHLLEFTKLACIDVDMEID